MSTYLDVDNPVPGFYRNELFLKIIYSRKGYGVFGSLKEIRRLGGGGVWV